jgi:hypothetical protein
MVVRTICAKKHTGHLPGTAGLLHQSSMFDTSAPGTWTPGRLAAATSHSVHGANIAPLWPMAIIRSVISSAALAALKKATAQDSKCPSKNIVSFPSQICEKWPGRGRSQFTKWPIWGKPI